MFKTLLTAALSVFLLTSANAMTIEPIAPDVKVCVANPCNGAQNHKGTAFYVGNDLFITAKHVVDPDEVVILKLETGTTLAATAVFANEKSDIALIKSQKPVTNLQTYKPDCREAVLDEQIVMTGHPNDLEFITVHGLITQGTRTKTVGNGMWEDIFIADLTSYGGFSGSAVRDTDNEVIGVLVGNLPGTSLTVVEPISKVCRLLNLVGINAPQA